MRIGQLTTKNAEEALLQRLRDRAALAVANGDLVDRSNGGDLDRRATEKRFVRQIEELAREGRFPHLVAEVFRDRQHALAGDALQHGRAERGRVDHAVADEEQVLPAAFAEQAAFIEGNALAVAVERGLHLDQAGVGVIGRALGQRGQRVRCQARPRTDADINAVLERAVAEHLVPFPDDDRGVDRAWPGIETELFVAAINQRPDVAALEAVDPHRVEHRLRELGLRPARLHAIDAAGIDQPPHVRLEPEDVGAALRVVRPQSFEDAGAVVKRVRRNVDGGVLPVHHRPVHPDLARSRKCHDAELYSGVSSA